MGLSDHRLISVTDEAVTFRTRGEDTATLHPHEFLRRFLQHVLPPGFVKLRHYGLLAPGNVNTKLVIARQVLERRFPTSAAAPPVVTAVKESTWVELLRRLTGHDVTRCAKCGGDIYSRPLDRPTLKDTS